MYYVGIDLHKNSITLCVVDQDRRIVSRKRFLCNQVDKIMAFFDALGPFEGVIEATSSYEWLFQRLEPLAQRMVLAHPGKLRVIAESTRKSDKLDAQVLAEFLALDMIPPAHRPTPRQRAHRALVRQQRHIKQRLNGVQAKIRALLANYNADRKNLFSKAGIAYASSFEVSTSDRFVLDQLIAEWRYFRGQLAEIIKHLRVFAESAPAEEKEARAILDSIPYVGPVTIDVICSELGDVRRFRSQKRACAYAGLVPGFRKSDGKGPDLGITKQGSGLLRWSLIQTAWRLVYRSRRWGSVFEALAKRRGKKRAITAVARRLLCVMVSMLQNGRRYQAAMV